MPTSVEVLRQGGLLSRAISGFTPREPQQTMASAIELALKTQANIIVEAGTGTGKTFGYLVPIFLSGKKTILSTGTKNLQDQLFFKDIPVIKKILSSSLNVVLLKGRANYLCKLRLHRQLDDGRFISKQAVTQLHIINEWAQQTEIGDIAELNSVPEDSTVWQQVTSTADNCLNQECEFYKECHVIKARQQAMAADIVVVNHYLFFADIALQEEGHGELLPGAETIVFDEAHHLPDIASQFFSTGITGRQLIELARDAEAEAYKEARDMQAITDIAHHLESATHNLRLALGNDLRRAPWPDKLPAVLSEAISVVKSTLSELDAILKEASVRGKGLENCARRSAQLIAHFNLLTSEAPKDTVHWFETYLQSFTIQFTPIIVAEHFQNHMKIKKRAWVFTSATLSVKNSFQLFTEALGLQQAVQLQLESPFDYAKQALLYVPRGLPDARSTHYVDSMIEAIIPVLEISQGCAFVLFTSYKALEYTATILKSRIPYPILLQGSMPKRELIEQFKKTPNAVLLGTSSFWYGVDVRGDALSCVIIDKLPFASPDDPLLQARIRMLRKQGMDPFQTHQLPNAVLTLKQGAGRLIRDTEDRGVLMICDPRLIGAKYGDVFLKSLPNMSRTRDLQSVAKFYEHISS